MGIWVLRNGDYHMIDSDKHKEDNIDNDTDSNGYDSNENDRDNGEDYMKLMNHFQPPNFII